MAYTRYILKHTTGIVLAHMAQRGGAHVSPGVLVRLGSTIAPVIALGDAHVPRSSFARSRYVRRTSGGGGVCIKYTAVCGVYSINDSK